MIDLNFEGRVLRLPASRLMEESTTRYANAWRGVPITVRLDLPFPAHRIARREMALLGDWFALDCPDGLSDVEFARRYAIPGHRNLQFPKRVHGTLLLPRGTTLHVGVCASLSGLPGGGIQGEWLDGPFIPSRIA